jgi:hypothetical protein
LCSVVLSMKALLKDRCQNNIAGISTQDKQKTGHVASGCPVFCLS